MDKNGYPSDEELATIRNWDYKDFEVLMEYVEDLWKYPNYFESFDISDPTYKLKIGIKYKLSTGGWSGNEDLIGALQENSMFWACYWQESKRGGHYVFEIRKVKDDKTETENKEQAQTID